MLVALSCTHAPWTLSRAAVKSCSMLVLHRTVIKQCQTVMTLVQKQLGTSKKYWGPLLHLARSWAPYKNK